MQNYEVKTSVFIKKNGVRDMKLKNFISDTHKKIGA